mgnify:CR=1 FL=1
MKIDVSDIVKTNGASMKVECSTELEDLGPEFSDYVFGEPIRFSGTMVNVGGLLKLKGRLDAKYTVKCYRCLKDVNREMGIDIKEDILNPQTNTDDESYTYEDNYVDIDRVLKDNIILNLPMKQLCSESCKGLCEICGNDLNIKECNCKKEQNINPSLEALKKFFNS